MRLRDVQRDSRTGKIRLTDVPELYSRWVAQDEALIFKDEQKGRAPVKFFALAPKRGNRAYVRRVEQRFKGIEEIIEQDVKIDPLHGRTNAVFVTATFDGAYDSRSTWETRRKALDHFKENLQREFGRSNSFRVYQAQVKRGGHCHPHLLIVFKHTVLKTFLHTSKNSKGKLTKTVRVEEKGRFERAWPYGFVDVRVPTSVGETRNEVLRYITRFVVQELPEGDSRAESSFKAFQSGLVETAAYEWFFNVRSFGISREWSDRLKKAQQGGRTDRLDTSECITRTFLGMSSLAEARRATGDRKFTGDEGVLVDMPVDFVERVVLPWERRPFLKGLEIWQEYTMPERLKNEVRDRIFARAHKS